MRLPLALAAVLLAAAPALAQELTDAELLRLFEAQREAFLAARTGGLGATRGLELVTVDDLTTEPELQAEPAAQTDLAQPAPPADGTAPDAGAGTDGGAAVAEAEPLAQPAAPDGQAVVFGQLAPELQVNVRVSFPFDSATLTDDQIPKLRQLCAVMGQSDIGLFRIVGHTDAAGTDAYNERLSLLRAEEVERWFVTDCGLAPSRLEAVGMGERFLKDPADPRASDNRRVEFQALS